MSVRVEFRWSEELLGRVDVSRGFESRASFVRRAVEQALALPESGRLGSVQTEAPEGTKVPERDTRFESRTSAPAEQPVKEWSSLEEHKAVYRRQAPVRRDVQPFPRGGS